MVERNADAAVDALGFPFAWGAYVDCDRRFRASEPFGGERRADAFGDRSEVRTRFEAAQPVLQIPGDLIEPDAAKPDRRLGFAPWIRDDHDRPVVRQHGARP